MTLDKIRVSGPRPSGPAGRSRPRERINFRARTFAKVALLTRSFFFFFFSSRFPHNHHHQKAVQTFVQKAKAEGVYTHMIPK